MGRTWRGSERKSKKQRKKFKQMREQRKNHGIPLEKLTKKENDYSDE